MTMGARMSFSVSSAGPGIAIGLILLAFVGFCSPIAYGIWWVFEGGEQAHKRAVMERMLETDPQEEARLALEKQDFRLYSTGPCLDKYVPGGGIVPYDEDCASRYRYIAQITDREASDADYQLNERAMKYMETYNRYIMEAQALAQKR